MAKVCSVYIMTNKPRGVLYTGVTSNLEKRVYQHKHSINTGFTSKYKLNKLVYFENTNDIRVALQREKQIKNWRRSWKIELIESKNPKWKDLIGDDSPDSGSSPE